MHREASIHYKIMKSCSILHFYGAAQPCCCKVFASSCSPAHPTLTVHTLTVHVVENYIRTTQIMEASITFPLRQWVCIWHERIDRSFKYPSANSTNKSLYMVVEFTLGHMFLRYVTWSSRMTEVQVRNNMWHDILHGGQSRHFQSWDTGQNWLWGWILAKMSYLPYIFV